MCEEERSLPILDIWPQYIKAILHKCLGEERCRENIRSILGYLTCARNNGDMKISDNLDAGFHEQFRGKENVNVETDLTKDTSEDESISDLSSSVHILTRRGSFSHEHSKAEARSHSKVKARSHSIFGVSRANRDKCWRQSEIDSNGYKTAEQIAYLRRMRGHSESSRRQWAKEVVLTRYLDGDSNRMSRTTGSNDSVPKRRHPRRGSPPEANFYELKTLSLKYERKVWARLQEGQAGRITRDVEIRTDSSENREEELTSGQSSSNEVLDESTSQNSHCVDVLAPRSSHNTGEGNCILVEQGEDTTRGVRSYKSEQSSTVYTGLSWLHVSSGMAEVERRDTTTRLKSDSTLLMYRRITCDDDVLRSASDGKLSQKRHELHETPHGLHETSRGHEAPRGLHETSHGHETARGDESSQNVVNTPALKTQFVQSKDEKIKMAEGRKSAAKSKEGFACRTNELQNLNKFSIADRSVEDSNDVTSTKTDVTNCPVYAITTPVFVTSKRVKMKTTEPRKELDTIIASSPTMSAPVVQSASVPCMCRRSGNRWRSQSLQDTSSIRTGLDS